MIMNDKSIKMAKDLVDQNKLLLNMTKWNYKTISIPNNYWAELIGFIIGDGSYCFWNKKLYAIRIYQKSTSWKSKKYLPQLLKKCNLYYTEKLHKNGMNIFYISVNKNNAFIKYINKYCPTKKINRDLLTLSQNNLKKIYNGLILSDGYYNFFGASLWQHNINDIHLFEELIVKIGKRFHTQISKSGFKKESKNYCIRISDKNFALLKKHKNIKKINYRGIVWCPTIKNGTWIAKRNGRAFITGNCGHTHGNQGTFKKLGRKSVIIDLSVDCWNFTPVNINEINQAYSDWCRGGHKNDKTN